MPKIVSRSIVVEDSASRRDKKGEVGSEEGEEKPLQVYYNTILQYHLNHPEIQYRQE